ncbi:hypothetical protein HH310_16130 [Actinoplanes sp. TBRC 11911]|uniref:hypothetical protein n=1 Tax=Actinoplanes sp. TBRC 11911 TaxID=2729386 RepID=UPI00145E884C|nr:hypothetical protein [Actinoplanes sp. TBRC 11911]NMO52713.1 hypothetical protein [Actinoplanes sp. TBRC 11911]
MTPDEPGTLSPAEQQLWDAFPYGRTVKFAQPQPVRASLIRTLLLGARPPEPGHRAALSLHGADITGHLDLYQAEADPAINFTGCTFDTVPTLSFARLRSVSFTNCTLPGLDAFAVTVAGSLGLVKSTILGGLVIYGAHVTGNIDLDWAHIRAGHRPADQFGDRAAAVFGEAVQIGRHLYLQGTTCTGDIDLTGMHAGGSIHAQQGLRVHGRLLLRSADITGEINLTDALLLNPGATALDAWGVRAGQLTLLAPHIEGTVDLRHAQFQILRDDPGHWPARLRLDGTRYTALEPAGTARTRLPWLDRDPAGYRPQPYEQLATLYRQIGHDTDARTVLLARQRRRRRGLTPPGQAWSLLQDILLGYGYRPGRAALWLLALTVAGTIVFTVDPPARGRAGTTFHPLVYTLDLLLPIVNFGQETTFGVSGDAQWLAYALTALGWLLFTAVAAALTRTFSRS